MLKLVHLKNFVICILIVALTIGNWGAFGSYVIAKASEELELQNAETKIKNVKFDIGVKDGDNLSHQLIGDINELAVLNAYILVENGGYLKDIAISFTGENENSKSFDIVDIAESDNAIKSVTRNELKLNQILTDKAVNIELSIKRSDAVLKDINDLNMNNRVKFVATYVSENGKETKIEKTVIININWKCNNNIVLQSEITGYSKFELPEENGIVITQKIVLDQDKEIGLPYENIEIETEQIRFNEDYADKVEIKKGNEEITFEELDNKNIKFIDVDKTSETNREYSITYVFNNKEISEIEVKSNVKAKAKIYNSDSEKEAEIEIIEELEHEIGKIVSIKGTEELSLSKGKIYANLNQGEEASYDVEYKSNIDLNIAYSEGIEEITLQDMGSYFVNEDDEKISLEQEEKSYVYFSNTKINTEEFEKVLGEEGKIEIQDEEGNKIATIDSKAKIEDGEYIVEYEQKISNLVFKVTKPIANGNIEIKNTKGIEKVLPFEKAELKTFKTIQDEIIGTYSVKEVEEKQQIESCFIENKLIETKTEATLNVETNKLSSITKNENIELKIELNNNKETSDLYESPSFEIELPKEISNITVKEANVLFDDELKILDISKSEKAGRIILNIILSGKQTDFRLDEYINGTTIVLNTDIDVDMRTASKTENIVMKYYNTNASTYNNTNYGECEASVEFIAPVAMIIGNEITNYNSNGEKTVSVLQGTKTGKLEIYTEEKIANNKLLVVNNTGNECEDLTILARIPFKNNTNILTGEELGTTEDTYLTEEVKVEASEKEVEIYYTDNGKADIDVNKAENKWTKEAIDLSTVQAFMIKVNGKIEQSEIINILYNFSIPANLEHNAYLYQDIVAYYSNNRQFAKVSETMQADQICLTTGRGPQMEMKQIASVPNGNTVYEGQKVRYTIEITNTGIDPIKNLVIKDIIPENAIYTAYTRNGFSMGYDEVRPDAQVLQWNIPNIEIGESIKAIFDVEVQKLPQIAEYYSNKENVFEEDGIYYIKEND